MASDSRRAAEAPAGTPTGETVIVTGAAGPLGRRVCELAAADPTVAHVVAIDERFPRSFAVGVEPHQLDLATTDLKPIFEGATTVLHLARSAGPERVGRTDASEHDATDHATRRVLDAASAVGVRHLVLLSSATAYGAWANNPIPLTEDAPLRPNPGVALAAETAEMERAGAEWRDAHPGSTVALLRPTVTLAAEGNDWLARALSRDSPLPVTDEEPPAQFLDVADLATAVDLARRDRLDGPRNVAPDGWIGGDTVRALAGGAPRIRLPERVAMRLAGWRWRHGLAPTPPELLPYTVHPWVIANDRLRADGWEPASTSEEAYVGSRRAGPWATMSPRRRQELALGAAAGGLAAVAAGIVALVRRRRRG